MKRTLSALLLALPLACAAQVTDVLFIGNSYIYTYDLPTALYNLALSGGDTIYNDSSTPGGATLQGHTTNTTTLSKISERAWDFVVVQEQSQMPSFPPAQVSAQTYPFAQILVDSIKSNNECTEPVFFLTWGRKYGDASNCANYPPLCTYNGMQARLRESYLQMGLDNSATVAPCGIAWKNSMTADTDSSINLYTGDNSHPSQAGTYLNACVFYATIFRKSPVGYSYLGGLTAPDALFLQEIAAATVLDSTDVWRIGANDPSAEFSVSNTGYAFQFTDNSLNADWHFWAFGDGATSQSPSPQHTYAPGTTVEVMHVAGNACSSDTVYTDIDLGILAGVNEANSDVVRLITTLDGVRSLQLTSDQPRLHMEFYSFDGRMLWQSTLDAVAGQNISLPSERGILRLSSLDWTRVVRLN